MDNQQQPPFQQPQQPQQQPPGPSGLGSLAQSSRLDALKPARWILIIVGILVVGFHAFALSNAEKEVDQAIRDEVRKLGPGFVVDQAKARVIKKQLIGQVRLIYGAHVFAGIVMIMCGILVFKMPVPATLTGLIIYLAIQGFSAIVIPGSITKGIILKIFIIIGLVKAVQAAFAYSKEQNLSGMQPAGLPPRGMG